MSKKDEQPAMMPLLRRIYTMFLRPYMRSVTLAVFFMIAASAMTALIAALMKPILDDVLYNARDDMIVSISIAIAVAFSVRGITTYFHNIILNRVGQSVVADIQSGLFAHFMRLDLSFFHVNPSGQLMSRVINDVQMMRMAISDTLVGFGKSFFTLIFLIALMVYRDWQLTLAAFIVFPMLAFFVVYIGKLIRGLSKNLQIEMGALSDLLSQVFQGVRLVKAYGTEQREIDRVTAKVHGVRDIHMRSVYLGNLSTPVNDVVVGFVFAGIIAYGGYMVTAGETTAGNLASFIGAFTLAYEPMKKLAKLNNTLQAGLGASERVFAMLDLNANVIDKAEAKALSLDCVPDVVFDNVHFSYDGELLKALQGISFTAQAGKVTALVGPSGGGKSTVMNLIPRFYDVHDGRIAVNGVDVRDLEQKSLRAHIALVSQDITIFNESVLDNIRYGCPQASDEAVFAAAEKAAAHTFILGLDNGYETVLGEAGVKLSGGQKQRISIARAILRDAPILLLDEATSALDNESERFVQEALKRLQVGRTTIVIAHRLTTVQDADCIVVLDRGCVAEIGGHDDLMKEEGLYARMYNTGMKKEHYA